MKKIVVYAIGLLLCALFLAVMPTGGEEGIYRSVVRLHVLANSDTEADQARKLAVRDAILTTYGDRLDCQNRAEAEAHITALLSDIRTTAEETLASEGCTDTVEVYFSEERYPTRNYGELHFPAGVYPSLRVVIGEGKGQNWWCVLFPPLCLDAAVGEVAPPPEEAPVGLTEAEWQLISGDGRYEIRFRVLELLSELAA